MIDQIAQFLFSFRLLMLLLAVGFALSVVYLYIFGFKTTLPEPTLLKGTSVPAKVIISNKEMLNHDTMRLTLKFPGEHLLLGLPIGSHIRV